MYPAARCAKQTSPSTSGGRWVSLVCSAASVLEWLCCSRAWGVWGASLGTTGVAACSPWCLGAQIKHLLDLFIPPQWEGGQQLCWKPFQPVCSGPALWSLSAGASSCRFGKVFVVRSVQGGRSIPRLGREHHLQPPERVWCRGTCCAQCFWRVTCLWIKVQEEEKPQIAPLQFGKMSYDNWFSKISRIS